MGNTARGNELTAIIQRQEPDSIHILFVKLYDSYFLHQKFIISTKAGTGPSYFKDIVTIMPINAISFVTVISIVTLT